MLSIAKRVDRHYAFDGWMVQLTEVPLVAIPTAASYFQSQIYPTGDNLYIPFLPYSSEVWPNAVMWISGM